MEIIVEDTGTGKKKMNASELQKIIEERTKPDYPFKEIRGRGLAKIVAAWTDELNFSDLPNGGIQVRIKKHLSTTQQSGLPQTTQNSMHLVLT